jgi:hypothetical protein
MSENEHTDEVPVVKEGLSAIVLPEIGKRDQFHDLGPVSQEEVLSTLNSFLEKLNQQGVDIVSILDIDVDMGRRGGVVGNVTETKKIAIVRKSPGK